MILGGELRSGDRLLNQNELAAKLGVSRPSLREALYTLKLMGAIEQRPGAGTVLRACAPALLSGTFDLPLMSDADGTLELMETRQLIEVGMVELAVDRSTAEELSRLKNVLKEMNALADKGEVDGYRERDLLFHHLIAQASHNRFILHLFVTIRRFLEQFLKESFDIMPDMLQHSQMGHKGIFSALESRDRKRAVKEMNKHLGLVRAAVENFFDKKRRANVS